MAGLSGPERSDGHPGVPFSKGWGEVRLERGGSKPPLPGVSTEGFPNCASNGFGSA